MRILHVDTGGSMRGGQWQAVCLVRELSRGGHENLVLAPTWGGLGGALKGGTIECAEPTPARLWRWSRRVDLVHCHDARGHSLAALTSRVPVVVSRRVAFPVRGGLLSRWKYRRAAHYIAISDAVARELLAAGVGAERITVVGDGVEVPPRTSTREGPVIAPATSDPRKGSSLLRRTGLDIHFSSNLAADLESARALVYITSSEGLGSAALLAMAHGVPVVASRVGGLPEIVLEGETGLLVENREEQIVAALARLESDHEFAGRLALAGRRMVQERFTVERMAEATLSVYRRVLG
jgi:glycosyltransferase involved in cell wall biosynthesis